MYKVYNTDKIPLSGRITFLQNANSVGPTRLEQRRRSRATRLKRGAIDINI